MNTTPTDENAGRLPGDVSETQSTLRKFCYPSAHSVKGRVLGALLRGERLTHSDCWIRFGSARLSHHIHRLRGIGWDVQTIEATIKTSDAGRPALIGVYSIAPEWIGKAGEPGQKYADKCGRIEAERRAA